MADKKEKITNSEFNAANNQKGKEQIEKAVNNSNKEAKASDDNHNSNSMNEEKFTESTSKTAANNQQASKIDETRKEKSTTPAQKTPASGKGLALLSIVIALALGAAGYFIGSQQLAKIDQKIAALTNQQPAVGDVLQKKLDDFVGSSTTQFTRLNQESQQQSIKIDALLREQSLQAQKADGLQVQLNTVNTNNQNLSESWLFSEADYLLTMASRKLLLDNDATATISLLKDADNVLSRIEDPQALPIRTAINNDIKKILSSTTSDVNDIARQLLVLSNNIDQLQILDINSGSLENANQPTDSITDWKENFKKNAGSFLEKFIVVREIGHGDKPLLAPDQDIYLRENIRLRLQIAILALYRQQSQLYKQSLETSATWIRSYFDTTNPETIAFLKVVDDLSTQQIERNMPSLTSLLGLTRLINKNVSDIDISTDLEPQPTTESN